MNAYDRYTIEPTPPGDKNARLYSVYGYHGGYPMMRTRLNDFKTLGQAKAAYPQATVPFDR